MSPLIHSPCADDNLQASGVDFQDDVYVLSMTRYSAIFPVERTYDSADQRMGGEAPCVIVNPHFPLKNVVFVFGICRSICPSDQSRNASVKRYKIVQLPWNTLLTGS